MFKPMKPETIERRKREYKALQQKNHAYLISRLQAKVIAEGPDSIWSEMLAETLNCDAHPRK